MVEFPEIARRRLQRGLTAGPNHPDPGLLTAFVEGSLPDRWRDQLLDHLAACSSCNELVALTAAQPVAQVAAKPFTSKWHWNTWAPLRWAAVAATAAVVVGAVWVGRIDRTITPPNHQVAVVTPAPANSAPTSQVLSPSLASETAARAQAPKLRVPRTTEVAKAPAPPRLDRALPRLPADAANVTMQSGAVPAPPSNDMYQTTITSNAPPEVSHATPTTASPSPANPGVPDPTAAAVPAKIQGAQWTVSSTGVLQNSMDGGKTWYPAMSSQPRIMRAVYAFANQVWAGGNSGLLLHSTDAGQHWETVTISSGDEKLTADIVRITFASPDRGVVVGTDGITWLTSDGGRTWKPWR